MFCTEKHMPRWLYYYCKATLEAGVVAAVEYLFICLFCAIKLVKFQKPAQVEERTTEDEGVE